MTMATLSIIRVISANKKEEWLKMEDNKNINNTEEVKEETKKKPMGIDLSSLPDPE